MPFDLSKAELIDEAPVYIPADLVKHPFYPPTANQHPFYNQPAPVAPAAPDLLAVPNAVPATALSPVVPQPPESLADPGARPDVSNPAFPSPSAPFDLSKAELVDEGNPATTAKFDVSKAELDRAESFDVKHLAKDDAFDPEEYFNQNKARVTDDPKLLEKLITVRQTRDNERSLVDFAKSAVKSAPKVVTGLGQVVAGGAEVASSVDQLLKHPFSFDIKKARETGGSILAGLESAATGTVNLLGKASEVLGRHEDILRGKTPAGALPGGKPYQISYEEARKRFFDKAATAEQEQRTATGQGELATGIANMGGESKLPVDPQQEAFAAFAGDPLNIAIGYSINKLAALGKIGAATKFAEGAIAAAAPTTKVVTAAERVGAVLGATGRFTEKAGNAAEKVADVAALATTASGGLLPGVLVRTAPKVITKVGEGLQYLGNAVDEGKLNALFKAGGYLVDNPVTRGTAQGVNTGLKFGAAFSLIEDDDISAGHALSGATITGGAFGAAHGLPAAGRQAGQALGEANQRIAYGEIAKTPVNSPAYGVDEKLDAVHAAQKAGADSVVMNIIDRTREKLRGEVRFYAVDPATFKDRAGIDAPGLTIAPTAKGDVPTVLINLGYGGRATLHEAGHVIEDFMLSEQANKTWLDQVERDYTADIPAKIEEYKPFYDAQGLTPEQQRQRAIAEIGAEVLSKALHSSDLVGTPPGVVKFATRILDTFAQKTGIFNPEAPGAVRTTLGHALKQGSMRAASDLANADIPIRPTPPSEPPVALGGTPAGPEAPINTVPIAPAAPNAPFPAPVAAAPVTPAAGNIRTTPGAQNAISTPEPDNLGIELARSHVAKNKSDLQTRKNVEDIASALSRNQGEVTPIEVEHMSVTPSEVPVENENIRLNEREAAYLKEDLGALPEDVRTRFQKILVPERFFISQKNKQLTLQGASLDKVLANTVHAVRALSELDGGAAAIPEAFAHSKGRLTEQGSRNFALRLEAYARNQANGYAGNGSKVVRTPDYHGPAENPNYNPVAIKENEAQFINLMMGRAVGAPKISRTKVGVKPRNIAARELAEANMREVQISRNSKPGDVFKAFGDLPIAEPNPLRNAVKDLGFDWRKLGAVTENVLVKNLRGGVKLRPDLNFRAPSSDLMRGGFMLAPEAGATPKTSKAAAREWEKRGTDSRYFRKWFGKSQVQDDVGNPITVYHGTTHKFNAFDPSIANPENSFGKGIYFSDSAADVNRNYAGEGPDLTNRIGTLAYRIAQQKDIPLEEALAEAQGQLRGPENIAIEGYLKLENPVEFDRNHTTRFEAESDEFGNTGPESPVARITDALNVAGEELGIDGFGDEIVKELPDPFDFSAEDLRQSVLNNDRLLDEARDSGDALVIFEALRRAFEIYGFDGIIDRDVPTKYKNMGIAEGTSHYIAFKPEQFKSAQNTGAFNPADKRFDFMLVPDESPLQFKRRKPLPNAVPGEIRGIHYSGTEGLTKLDPERLGTGKANAMDRAGLPKTFFFAEGSNVEQDNFLTKGAHVYGARISGDAIYDMANDPLGIESMINREERDQTLQDNGYKGYYTERPDGRKILAVYNPVKVVALGKTPASGSEVASSPSEKSFMLAPPEGEHKFDVVGTESDPPDINLKHVLSKLDRVNDAADLQQGYLNTIKFTMARREHFRKAEVVRSFNRNVEGTYRPGLGENGITAEPDKPDVVLHEAVHAVNDVYGHAKDWLLDSAYLRGALDEIDYNKLAESFKKLGYPQLAADAKSVLKNNMDPARALRDGVDEALAQVVTSSHNEAIVPVEELARAVFGNATVDFLRNAAADEKYFPKYAKNLEVSKLERADYLAQKSLYDKLEALRNERIKILYESKPDGAMLTDAENARLEDIRIELIPLAEQEKDLHEKLRVATEKMPPGNYYMLAPDKLGFRPDQSPTPKQLKERSEKLRARNRDISRLQKEYPNAPVATLVTDDNKNPVYAGGNFELVNDDGGMFFKAVEAAAKSKLHPEQIPLEIRFDKSGAPIFEGEGKNRQISFQKIDYNILGGPKVPKRFDKAVDYVAGLLTKSGEKFKQDPELAAAIGWYTKMTEWGRKTYGASFDLFGELLGATSPNTDVRQNFSYSLEAMERYSKGDYEGLMERYDNYIEAKAKDLLSDETAAKYKAENPEASDADFAEYKREQLRSHIHAFDENPLRPSANSETGESDTNYGLHGQRVLQVLHGIWADNAARGKATNFARNILGTGHDATVDVWMARVARREVYNAAGGIKKWRIPQRAELPISDNTTVSGERTGDFNFLQKVIAKAADALGMRPDDAQALFWFGEKQLWSKNKWTKGAGSELSSFEASTAKNAADRYVAGVTTFTVPEKFDSAHHSAELANLRKEIQQTQPGIVNLRTRLSEGMYTYENKRQVEPTFDAEVAVRQGTDATPFLKSVLDTGVRNAQNDTLVMKILEPGSGDANARPGVEVHFRETPSSEQLHEILDAYTSQGVDGFKLDRNQRNEVSGFIAAYVPEITGRYAPEHLDIAQFPANAERWATGARLAKENLLKSHPDAILYTNEIEVNAAVWGKEEYGKVKAEKLEGRSIQTELGRRKSILPEPEADTQPVPGDGDTAGAGINIPIRPAASGSEVASGKGPAGSPEIRPAVPQGPIAGDIPIARSNPGPDINIEPKK